MLERQPHGLSESHVRSVQKISGSYILAVPSDEKHSLEIGAASFYMTSYRTQKSIADDFHIRESDLRDWVGKIERTLGEDKIRKIRRFKYKELEKA